MVWDWEAWWALELEWRPSVDVTFRERVEAFYAQLWGAHLTVDFVHPEADLARYPLVVVPSLYLATAEAAKNLDAYVRDGLADADLGRLLERVYADANLAGRPALPSTLELVRRPPYLIAINHGTSPTTVHGTAVQSGEVLVLRQEP